LSSLDRDVGVVSTSTAEKDRPRILLAPVTISPTKPLTPTHIRYLLLLDMLYRASSLFADVTYLYHHASYAGSQQVAGFWHYLDRRHRELDYSCMSEEDIGRLYAGAHRESQVPFRDIEPMVRRAEAGWTHPATARVLDLWGAHYQLLGLADPSLGRTGPPLAATDEVINVLTSRNLALDARELGAPVYLDATPAGLPLRGVQSAEGQTNYLLYTLREIIPQLSSHDLVVFAHDEDLRTDYQTLVHIVTSLGVKAVRFEVSRVAIDGVAQSSRFGGWGGSTLGAFSGPLVDEFGIEAFQLGLRLYLVAGLNRSARDSFSLDQLRRWTGRATRLLARHGADRSPDGMVSAATVSRLAAVSGRRGYVSPYQLAAALLSRDTSTPVPEFIDIVMRRVGTHRQVRNVDAPWSHV
jgi:hypothetical protein